MFSTEYYDNLNVDQQHKYFLHDRTGRTFDNDKFGIIEPQNKTGAAKGSRRLKKKNDDEDFIVNSRDPTLKQEEEIHGTEPERRGHNRQRRGSRRFSTGEAPVHELADRKNKRRDSNLSVKVTKRIKDQHHHHHEHDAEAPPSPPPTPEKQTTTNRLRKLSLKETHDERQHDVSPRRRRKSLSPARRQHHHHQRRRSVFKPRDKEDQVTRSPPPRPQSPLPWSRRPSVDLPPLSNKVEHDRTRRISDASDMATGRRNSLPQHLLFGIFRHRRRNSLADQHAKKITKKKSAQQEQDELNSPAVDEFDTDLVFERVSSSNVDEDDGGSE